jgi:hypothetical protein
MATPDGKMAVGWPVVEDLENGANAGIVAFAGS